MTLHELSRVYLLRRAQAKLHGRLCELRAAASSIPVSRVDGMPRAPFHAGSRVEGLSGAVIDLEIEIADLELEIRHEECTLQRFVSTVPDARMRLILQFRFVDCLPWSDVARKLDPALTGDVVKQQFKRFLKGYPQKAP